MQAILMQIDQARRAKYGLNARRVEHECHGHDQHGNACGREGEQKLRHLSPTMLFELDSHAHGPALCSGDYGSGGDRAGRAVGDLRDPLG
jgi:hypothetical protein